MIIVVSPDYFTSSIHFDLKILLPSFALIIISVWALLSIFWGSNYRLEYYFYRIAIDIYDFDSLATTNPLLGPDVVQGQYKFLIGERREVGEVEVVTGADNFGSNRID